MNNNKKVVTFDDLVKRYKKMYMEVKKQNNMKTFSDLVFKDLKFKYSNSITGVQARITFENGYGASVVKSPYSYGGRMGLYELTILDEKGHIYFPTPISDSGVIGYLKEEDVTEAMRRIQELKPKQ